MPLCWVILKKTFQASPPPVESLLKADETIINPYYMGQLLEYGMKLKADKNAQIDSDFLVKEAEVFVYCSFEDGFISQEKNYSALYKSSKTFWPIRLLLHDLFLFLY